MLAELSQSSFVLLCLLKPPTLFPPLPSRGFNHGRVGDWEPSFHCSLPVGEINSNLSGRLKKGFHLHEFIGQSALPTITVKRWVPPLNTIIYLFLIRLHALSRLFALCASIWEKERTSVFV